MHRISSRRVLVLGTVLSVLVSMLVAQPAVVVPVHADPTPNPSSVTIAGSLQSELGCPGDWQPDCAATHLGYDADDDVWQGTFSIPPGAWEYKAALNDSWDENYGANASQNGANIGLVLASDTSVKFYYDHKSHWVTDNVNSVIATVPGSFQSELGCPGDWDPGCLRSWLQDPDGDGTYGFSTIAIPAGSYEAKVAYNESWDVNYGAGGVQNGPNIPFSVAVNGSTVTFTYDPVSHILTIGVVPPGSSHDNNVEYLGLGHNSQDSLYRVPFGAITPATELILRFRTYHNDVTGVQVRFWDDVAGKQFFREMEIAASDVSCYDPGQPDEFCDFWELRLAPPAPTTLYYRFIIHDGTATAYYDDDAFLDGEWGEATPQMRDNSYVVTVYDPAFHPIPWLENAVVYQIFPDRFRNGRSNNDPLPTEPRYGYPPSSVDQILIKQWGDLPEGYCRGYVAPAQACEEEPLGRDYFGGDLRGIMQRLNYLQALGVTALYLNPIFESASNHGYDTQDYYSIDHFFGSNKEFDQFVQEADKRGIRIILDGVFNHVSSDSPFFDRYGHFSTVGACESVDSLYRDWFGFRPQAGGPCAGPDGPNTMTYDGWFGFDTLPVLNKSNPEVRDLVYAAGDAVARYWLEKGAAGWRLDVMGDTSFPADFWPEFRQAVKATDPEAAIIGELWKKSEVIVKSRGDQADTTMNYRFRNAILGFLGTIDDKGFVDDGQTDQPPSLFVRKLDSIREDYPDATYYTLLNLLDSHDTKRILWSLTPGENNREAKELDAANLARGKQLLRLATVVQMTIPGAPTIYYGDEVGVTGDDDPDDRRTFPWDDLDPYGIGGDPALLEHYQELTDLRESHPVFRSGELTFLLADDQHRTLAYLMRTESDAAVVAVNRSDAEQALNVDVSGLLPGTVAMYGALGNSTTVSAQDGVLNFTLSPLSATILLPAGGQDLTAPVAPADLHAVEGNGQVGLIWDAVTDAASYEVYRSPVSGGGYVAVAQTGDSALTDTGVVNGQDYYYVVSAVDAAGNEGAWSNETSALPHYSIGWANTQWPPTLSHVISVVNRTDNVYGQVWIDGVTSQPGATPGLIAQLGFGPDGSNPAGDPDWIWVDATFNVDVGNNDEFVASLLPESVGSYDYLYRYSTTGGRDWLYADLSGPVPDGSLPANPGVLTVSSSGDVTPPDTPTGLTVVSASPVGIELAWDAVMGDPTLYGYEVRRSDTSGGPYTTLALVAGATNYVDAVVDEGATYYYVVRSVDTSFNRSADSAEVVATAERRTVTVTFTVTVPSTTDGTGRPVYIAGTLDRLDGGLPSWDPGGVVMTRLDATHWTIALTGAESTEIEYKYVLGDWLYVEKGASCEELANRALTLTYGTDGTQIVDDTVLNWRNVSPCGN